MPASEKRAVSRISGGQSVTPILPATKAKLQSRQNRPIYNGSGLKAAARGTAMEGASDMEILLCHGLGPRLDIWKLNAKLTVSGFINGERHVRSGAFAQLRLGG